MFGQNKIPKCTEESLVFQNYTYLGILDIEHLGPRVSSNSYLQIAPWLCKEFLTVVMHSVKTDSIIIICNSSLIGIVIHCNCVSVIVGSN